MLSQIFEPTAEALLDPIGWLAIAFLIKINDRKWWSIIIAAVIWSIIIGILRYAADPSGKGNSALIQIPTALAGLLQGLILYSTIFRPKKKSKNSIQEEDQGSETEKDP